MENSLLILFALPLVWIALVSVFHPLLKRSWVAWLSTAVVGCQFLLALKAFLGLQLVPEHQIQFSFFQWFSTADFKIEFAVLWDHLSAVLALMITFISFWIHLYSIGYMAHDNGIKRFFVLMNLFTLSMLVLVLANNYLLMFLGWEGVGLCSYFLIGFWFHKESAAAAAKKAFVVNRIGDVGLFLGILWLALQFKTLNYLPILDAARVAFPVGSLAITLITLLLFWGAVGKSAQFPLHVWLPDAMEGPTPVSALIHAATLVTAGIYLMARSHLLFALAPVTLWVVAIVGIATALLGATQALVQTDLKKVLAYSTVSQLGLMTLACGLGAFSVAIFHLLTHAAFKALLFLSAGSIIHALHDEQDLRKMGGLLKYLPFTFVAFLVGAASLAGIPGFAGFFSKDEILSQAFISQSGGNFVFWILGVITAFLTGLYIFRALMMVFVGTPSKLPNKTTIHESPWVMLLPLGVLSVLATFAGFWNIPKLMGGKAVFEAYLEPVFARLTTDAPLIEHFTDPGLEWFILIAAVVFSLYAVFLGVRFYFAHPEIPKRVAKRFRGLYTLLTQQYYLDAFYQKALVMPYKKIALHLWYFWDEKVLQNLILGFTQIWLKISYELRKTQSGNLSHYLMILSLMLLLLLILKGF